jgi:GR25 family glycosyltransferase involved in LPS biosynthesis
MENEESNRKFNFNKSNTFCISLESNLVRMDKMKRRFKHLEMDVTMYKAVSNDEELNVPFVNNLNKYQKYCSQSHINLWKYIVTNYIPYSLIIEDDACFDLEWKSKLDLFESQISDPELDAIFLNVSEPVYPLFTWVKTTENYLTGGYIITYKGAKTLLKMFSGAFCSSDWMTSRLQTLGHSYTFYPWLIIQEGNESMIGSNFKEDCDKVISCLNKIPYSLSNYII